MRVSNHQAPEMRMLAKLAFVVAGRVEVVDHASAQKPISSMSKTELKKFMVFTPSISLPFRTTHAHV